MPYIFDTNSIRVLRNYYPKVFSSFWKKFDAEVSAGQVVSVREVYNELERQISATWLWDWVKHSRKMFLVPGKEESAFVAQIFQVAHFRGLVGEAQQLRGHPVADPFVIASAAVLGGCVVSEEVRKPNAAKIPNVCEHFGVSCINVEGFMAQGGWQF